MKKEITNCLFHGVSSKNIFNNINFSNYDLFPIDILNEILVSGYIKTREALFQTNMIVNKKPNWNKQNNVSLCIHPQNQIIKIKLSKFHRGPEIAFNYFVLNNPSIILDSKLLNELKINKSILNLKMSDEIQIKENIPLSYMVAIGLPDNTLKLQKRVVKLLNLINNYPMDNVNNIIDKIIYDIDTNYNLNQLTIENNTVEKIKELLIINNYKCLIIEPSTGEIYPTIKEKQLRLDQIKKELNKL